MSGEPEAQRTAARLRDDERRAAWAAPAQGPPVFCALATSGPDPALDSLLALRALRAASGAAPEERMELELAAPAHAAERDPDAARAAWTELLEFARGGPLIVAEAEAFSVWSAHLAGTHEGAPLLLGLDELAALFLPGRLALRRSELVAALSGAAGGSPAEDDPLALRAAFTELVRRFLALAPDARQLLTSALREAWWRLGASDAAAAQRVGLALALVAEPDRWGAPADLLQAEERPFPARALEPEEIAAWLAEERPRCSREPVHESGPPLPADGERPLPFPDEDRALLDELFEVHLAESFSPGEPAAGYRESQHGVACAVATAFGSAEPELLLVHAPTGTGKTLAYLLPAMIWARRHGVRVGVATYTRALQEQAMEREVPRARAALERAGAADELRINTLKGRENYLCWRALKLLQPEEEAPFEEWLAWAQLVGFGLGDPFGDLDRFPLRAPVRLESSARYARVLRELTRQARARTSCCTTKPDRATCAAEVARRRAERSHVVITNHSFALARQDFFRHMVFDECEHLHDQAHAAWSHAVPLRAIREWIERVQGRGEGRGEGRGGGGARGLLPRVARKLVPGTPSHETWEGCGSAARDADTAFRRLGIEIEAFLLWRADARRARGEREEHSLMREYAESAQGAGLVDARLELSRAGARLDARLAELDERLGALSGRGFARLCRATDLARTDLDGILAGLEAWIPTDEGRPRFGPQTFYDVAVDSRGEPGLAARVLLPNEYLGRFYHPRLSTGVFLSATTWLQGGFEAATGYLGLDRAAEPAPDEDRPARHVRTYRAPEVFDYRRVLVAVPRDAPPAAREKEAFLAYTGRFLSDLGERTRGRILGLFTNAEDVRRVGARLEGFFRARRIPFWYQGMKDVTKEQLGDLFRRRVDSILLGVDTFWYGADFPGESLEYLVIARLPYGVPDSYHHAQCAALGSSEQRRRIYLPRALAKFRQGFGRLMRTVDDRGCVFMLDNRILEPRHRQFLRELPIRDELMAGRQEGARLVRGDTELCLREALAHMGLAAAPAHDDERPPRAAREEPPRLDLSPDELPY